MTTCTRSRIPYVEIELKLECSLTVTQRVCFMPQNKRMKAENGHKIYKHVIDVVI